MTVTALRVHRAGRHDAPWRRPASSPACESGWDAFTGFMAVALTVLGALVPWLIVIVPLAWAVWLVVRRSPRDAERRRPAG